MKETGRLLRTVSRQNGFAVKDIQTALGLASNQAIYDWYNGKTLPTLNNFLALSRLFEVPMDGLIVSDMPENLAVQEKRGVQEELAVSEKRGMQEKRGVQEKRGMQEYGTVRKDTGVKVANLSGCQESSLRRIWEYRYQLRRCA